MASPTAPGPLPAPSAHASPSPVPSATLLNPPLSHRNSLARCAGPITDKLPTEVANSMGGVFLLWKHMVYAPTEEHFDAAWAGLQAAFFDQPRIISYIRTTWMPYKAEWAHPWISRNENMGCRTTSPAECANHTVKSYVVNGNASIHQLHEAIQDAVHTNKREFITQQGGQKMRTQYRDLGKEWLGDCPRAISNYGVDLLVKQYQLMRGVIANTSVRPFSLKPCTGSFTKQYGLPCSHELLDRYQSLENGDKVIVNSHDCALFWHLERRFDEDNPYLNILDPHVNLHPRGRPRGDAFALPPEGTASRVVPPSQAAPSQATRPGVRRYRSEWELVGDLADEDGDIGIASTYNTSLGPASRSLSNFSAASAAVSAFSEPPPTLPSTMPTPSASTQSYTSDTFQRSLTMENGPITSQRCSAPVGKRRGRPKGSKNKNKPQPPQAP